MSKFKDFCSRYSYNFKTIFLTVHFSWQRLSGQNLNKMQHYGLQFSFTIIITFLLISSQEDSTQYSDGVPFVTQCPILPGQEFKWYNFNAEPAGTFWFHSHNPFQRDDGAYGTLVIRDHPGI